MSRSAANTDAATGDARPTLADTAIECRNVYKLFGKHAIEAKGALVAEGLSKAQVMARFDCVVGVCDVSFSVRRGEVFCIMGLSGSGKSTLVRHINRLIDPTSGRIFINGEEIGSKSVRDMRRLRAEKIGMVFQGFGLMPHLNVRDNVAFGLELRHVPRELRLAIADEKLALVQLEDWGDHWPHELSGGMQQRVGLARALASDPDILLLDEPFSALDPVIRRQQQELFRSVAQAVQKTTVFITHDLDEAMQLGDRIAIMRDGSFVQVGRPSEIVTAPCDAYVAEFVEGISPLKVLSAGDIMDRLDPVHPAALSTQWPRVEAATRLDCLVDLVSSNETPVVITAAGVEIGIVEPKALWRSIAGHARHDHKSVPNPGNDSPRATARQDNGPLAAGK
jgi:glycine betaine/proline transport system ATP-binding protein